MIADKGDAFQIQAKDCLPALEIPLNLLHKVDGKFEEEDRGESHAGFVLSYFKNCSTGAYSFWELWMAQDSSYKFKTDLYPIQRVGHGSSQYGICIANRESRIVGASHIIAEMVKEFKSQVVVPKADHQSGNKVS